MFADPLVALADALTAAGVPAAMDPDRVNTPGAWVTVEGIARVTAGGGTRLDAAVYLVARDADYRRAWDALGTLYAAAVPAVFTPDGLATPTGVVLPGDPTPLPGLRIPVHLFTT